MSLFDTMISATDAEAPAFRQAPEGNYLVTVRAARKVKANSGTEGIELQFTIQENLDEGADLEGVTLSKVRLRDTLGFLKRLLSGFAGMLYALNRLRRASLSPMLLRTCRAPRLS